MGDKIDESSGADDGPNHEAVNVQRRGAKSLSKTKLQYIVGEI